MKSCLFCQIDFAPRRKSSKFCSKSCAARYTNLNRNEVAVRKKISETKKRQFSSGEVKHSWLGRRHSQKTKDKISQVRIEKKLSLGENNPMFGKKHTRETKEVMSKIRTEKILNGEYSEWFKKGVIWSTKMNKEMYFRSAWEECVLKKIEQEDDVLFFDVEPFSIPYRYGTDNHKRHYIPDILMVYKNGTKKLIEIKPKQFVGAEINKAKFSAAIEYCQKCNMLFEVWTEKEIRQFLEE